MVSKTLVCVTGQVRIPTKTWPKFKEYVLDQFDADLALCIHDNGEIDRSNEYFKNAKYVFEYKNTTGCWASAFDKMNPGWRQLVNIPGDWIAPIKEPIKRSSSGGLVLFMFWFLYQNIKTLLDKYDQIIVTRSDYFWTKPHPKLDSEHIWFIKGEFHGGISNRHIVFHPRFAEAVLTIGTMEDLNKTSESLRRYFIETRFHFLFNVEGYMYVRFQERGLCENIGFFPMTMFLASDTRGVYHPLYDINVVYPDELDATEGTCVTWPWRIDHRHVSRNGMFCGRVTSD